VSEGDGERADEQDEQDHRDFHTPIIGNGDLLAQIEV
jgi:hypothetical protein